MMLIFPTMKLLAIMVALPNDGLEIGDDAYDDGDDDVQGLMPKELGKTFGDTFGRNKKRWGKH